MTTSLQAIAGPSKLVTSPPKVEPSTPDSDAPLKEVNDAKDMMGDPSKVPAFLSKLYRMVSDVATDELIYWSDAGTSFFVPNTERFGKEILPRFFKHNNFSSFVRQLNMYGFHKVPQPQTGVLRSDNPDGSELWEFTNPSFKRDQPELLGRVTRKNNRPNALPASTSRTGGTQGFGQGNVGGVMTPGGQFHPVHLITDGSTEGEAGMLVGPTGQQMLDLSAINSGIAAIRQTQASIGADLKALQSSNEHLWREAIEARERHQKHAETIDLIITFLERLFGTEGEGLKGLKEVLSRGRIPRPNMNQDDEAPGSAKKRRRVGLDRMIRDGRGESNEVDENGQIVELPSETATPNTAYSVPITRKRARSVLQSEPPSTTSDNSQRFQTLPDDSPRLTGSPNGSGSASASGSSKRPAYPANHNLSHTNADPNALIPYSNPNNMIASQEQLAQSLNLDPALLQTTIGSLLQSPAAAEMFLNSLTHSVQGQALNQPQSNGQGSGTNNAQPNNYFSAPTQTNGNPNNDPTLALFSPLPNQAALLANNDELLRSYQEAVGVGADAQKLQESIDSLVRSMGLQPSGVAQPGGSSSANGYPSSDSQNGGQSGGQGMDSSSFGGAGGGMDDDFDVDQFLNSLSKDNE